MIRGYSSLFFFWLIIGFAPIVGGISIKIIDNILLVFLASLIGFLYFLPYLIKNKEFTTLFNKNNFIPFLVIANFGSALPFCCLLYALNFTTPANTAILNQFELLYSFIFSIIFLKEKVTFKQILASLLIVLGGVILMSGSFKNINLKGDLIVIFSVWMFQVSHIAAKKLSANIPCQVLAAAKNLYALPLMFVLLIIYSNATFIKPGATLYGIIFYMGVIRYGLSYLLWFWTIQKLSLPKVTAIALSYPALTLILSCLFGYDKLTLYNVMGLILSMLGATMLSKMLSKEIKNAK
ncbi:MAG: EamA family transporter [Elusimicrobiaceae bacterium]|nr:EamA family transporter [Elusimicrobiaceae bacterium]